MSNHDATDQSSAPAKRPGSTIYGYPRQGRNRELKRLTERFWAGRISPSELLSQTADLRAGRRAELISAGLTEIPSNDFSLYDHVLDTAVLFDAVPQRHRQAVPQIDTQEQRLARYFAMARGTDDVVPLEMTKWFDTNYHYLVPELEADQQFRLFPEKILTELTESAGSRPVLLGPYSFLKLSRSVDGSDPLQLIDRLLPSYLELLALLADRGCDWLQLDEPALVLDLDAGDRDVAGRALAALVHQDHRPKILLASYFDDLGSAFDLVAGSGVEGLALDFTGEAANNLDLLRAHGPLPQERLVAGVIDGRNVWAPDLSVTLIKLEEISGLASRVDVAASCSLLHVPIDVEAEDELDPQIRGWLSFAQQKLNELTTLARGLANGGQAIGDELETNRQRLASRAESLITQVAAVRDRAAKVGPEQLHRGAEYPVRAKAQHEHLGLPELPVTTIGSFPQTTALRTARADHRKHKIDQAGYDRQIKSEIDSVIEMQERLGVDVLVHGEPERNDMVQYFAEQLEGYLSTKHGWVQSYGSRYVRPPILAGDISRPHPMSVRWSQHAQSRTSKPVKGMLTGPVTMLAWSFVRDDLPQDQVARQVALALRDEVADLEAAGISVIQMDEPALRETLPLKKAQRQQYLDWAVDAFRLSTASVADHTQVHTHMCYADFADIMSAIIDMDADVISLEAARSAMTILDDLEAVSYPREVGPGVWDIHSPRVPSTEEVTAALRNAIARFPADRLWVNPDCGLKTRNYAQTEASIDHLVRAAQTVRAELPA